MASSGPNYPSSISTASYPRGADWTNAANVGADDNTYASVALNNQNSYYLKCQNFGFSVPAGYTIDGITVEIGAYANSADRISYTDVQLLDANGTATGTDKGTGTLGTSEATATFGGTSDTWTASPTAAMVNDADFGVVVRLNNASPFSYTAYVDFVRVTVTYTPASVTAEGTLQVGATSTSGEGTVTNPVGFLSWPLRWLGIVTNPSGDGTLQVGPVTMAGEGIVIVPVSGTGTLLVGATSIYGEGVVGYPTEGTLSIGEISISGEGVARNPITIVGTLTVGAVSVSGTGAVIFRFSITYYRRYKPTTFVVTPRTTEFSMSNRGATIYVPSRTRTFVAPSRT